MDLVGDGGVRRQNAGTKWESSDQNVDFQNSKFELTLDKPVMVCRSLSREGAYGADMFLSIDGLIAYTISNLLFI